MGALPAEERRRRRRIALVVGTVMLWLPIQFGLRLFLSEPYPGIIGPGFAGSPSSHEWVLVQTCTAEIRCATQPKTSEPKAVSCAKLIAGLSLVRSNDVLKRLFPDSCEQQPTATSWVGRLKRIRKNFYPKAYCEPFSPELTRWLKQVCSQAAQCDATSVDVVRNNVTHHIQSGSRKTKEQSRQRVVF